MSLGTGLILDGNCRAICTAGVGKALKILAGGGDVDYVGASAVELIGPGESAGNYRRIAVKGGKFTTVSTGNPIAFSSPPPSVGGRGSRSRRAWEKGGRTSFSRASRHSRR